MINSPFNYTGSKFKLLPQIIPHFDTSKKKFIDLFAGGGSVYTNIIHLYEDVWVNDIIDDLMCIHYLIQKLDFGYDKVSRSVENKKSVEILIKNY